MSSSTTTSQPAAKSPGLGIEANGINVIDESERKGTPSQLFWPWAASNISILGMAWGAYVLSFGVSLWQGLVAGAAGVLGSFLLVGLVAIAGKRGSAPTLTLSRAAFGIRGNIVPGVVSYLPDSRLIPIYLGIAFLGVAWPWLMIGLALVADRLTRPRIATTSRGASGTAFAQVIGESRIHAR